MRTKGSLAQMAARSCPFGVARWREVPQDLRNLDPRSDAGVALGVAAEFDVADRVVGTESATVVSVSSAANLAARIEGRSEH
jgi:hypothetical protein